MYVEKQRERERLLSASRSALVPPYFGEIINANNHEYRGVREDVPGRFGYRWKWSNFRKHLQNIRFILVRVPYVTKGMVNQ